ncbi:uncharacterized protein [Euwallacea fornicatus]|uniref:uncharacterized protein isoform X1 n=2 Tax=Euwallacea fornicatus TaxID=995702 RepID=UPI00338E5211
MGPTTNSISASANDQIIQLENKSLPETSQLKRKRGRPKKNINSSEELPLKLPHDPPNSVILRKRSCKKTKILSESDSSEMEDSLANIQNSIKESPSFEQRNENLNTAMKRKRGRPRKNQDRAIFLASGDSGMEESVVGVHNAMSESSELNKTSAIKKQAGGSQKKQVLPQVPIQIDQSSCEAGTSSNMNSASNDGKVLESVTLSKNSSTFTMLNQVFKGFLGKMADGNSEGPENEVVRRKGRLPMNIDSLLDETGESVCMVCNATVPNLQWICHKREEHYNLTWRKGNPAMDILDPSVIQNSLKQLLEEQQYLKCKKCKKTHNTVKSFITHLELCEGVVNSEGRVRCAICNEELEKGKWVLHRYKKHNNLAWRVGDTPLNLEDRDLVMKILTSLYKSKKPFFCEVCGEQKKSVVGYLSHKGVCQWSGLNAEQAKVTCELCGRKMLPVSMDSHMKVHNKAEAARKAYNDELERIEAEELGPRRAALQALQVIETMKDEGTTPKLYTSEPNFNDSSIVRQLKKNGSSSESFSCIFTGCPCTTSAIDDMVQHLEKCDKKPNLYYLCKLCLTWTLTETVIVEHINKTHNKVKEADAEFSIDGEIALQDEEDDTDDKDGESERLYDEFERKRRLLRLKAKSSVFDSDHRVIPPLFLANTLKWDYSLPQYPQAYNWTFNFCDKYYTDFPIFDSQRNKSPWQVLDGDILDEYLPKNYESYSVAVVTCDSASTDISDALEFTKLDLFEARQFQRDEATIFCGGPIISLAWLPTSHNQINREQILAVSVLNDSRKEYLVGQIYRERCVVQFWNFGILNYEQEIVTPFLLYGLALNTGPVWHLEWCPSGCFDNADTENTRRLGLLAVATSDSFVYVYSIDNVAEENEKGLIYKGDPVLKLRLEDGTSSLDHEHYATRISWTKVRGHKYVAVGYSSGLLAIYNLSSTNLFDRGARSEIYTTLQTVFPYLTFQAHYSCITGLSLLHYGDGNRYCFSTSFDKQSIYWDLFKQAKIFSQRKHATEGMWLTNWPVALQPEDETHFFAGYANTYSNPLRDVINTGSSVFSYSGSGINTLCFNDWLNLIVQGGNAGEVMGMFAHKMFCSTDKRKKGKYRTNKRKSIFTGTKMIRKDRFADGTADDSADQRDGYNIVFMDYSFENLAKNNDSANCVGPINSIQQYSSDQYPLLAIRKVATNPNREACMFYATGHQSGFLRLRKLDCLGPRFSPKTFNDSACVDSL